MLLQTTKKNQQWVSMMSMQIHFFEMNLLHADCTYLTLCKQTPNQIGAPKRCCQYLPDCILATRCRLALQFSLTLSLCTCKRHNDAVNRVLDAYCYYCVVVFLSHAAQGSFLNSFLTNSASMDPEQRGRFLEEPPEGAPDIDKAHEVVLLTAASMLGLQGASLLPLP